MKKQRNTFTSPLIERLSYDYFVINTHFHRENSLETCGYVVYVNNGLIFFQIMVPTNVSQRKMRDSMKQAIGGFIAGLVTSLFIMVS